MTNEETTMHQDGGQVSHRTTRVLPPQGSKPWKKIVIGGTSGILLGAGGAIAALTYENRTRGNVVDSHHDAETGHDITAEAIIIDETDKTGDDIDTPEMVVETEPDYLGVPVAYVNDGMTFGEAFADAREQVGPGGVFEWRGGIFNTYFVEEWDEMTAEDKTYFAQQVSVTISAEEMDEVTMFADRDDSEVFVVPDDDGSANNAIVVDADNDDVRILGKEYDGYAIDVLDVYGDDEADFAVIDMNDDYELSEDGIIVYSNDEIAPVDEPVVMAENLDGDVDDGVNDIDDEHFIQDPDLDDVPDFLDGDLIDI